MSFNITACQRCGGSITNEMRFCPSCGKRLVARDKKLPIFVLLAGIVVFGAGFALQGYLIPPRPAASVEQDSEESTAFADDPQLKILRQQLDQDPENLEKLKMVAGALGDKIRLNPGGPPALAYEAIDVLSRILVKSPNDTDALLMMADVSFDQKAFTQAETFYEKFLAFEPENRAVRVRYASTLTFLGKFEESLKELQAVLKQDPKNFPAMAYLSITYAQQGDIAKAKELGAAALKLAPSEEARTRFTSFLTSLDGEAAQSSSPARGNMPQAQAPSGAGEQGVEAFIAKIRANPVAGPKFVNFEGIKDGELKLFFKDFPMGQMPPFAKEKFFGSLRQSAAAAGLDSLQKITFVDVISGSQMEQISLAK